MTSGQVILAAAAVFAVGFGLWRLFSDGRFSGRSTAPEVHEPAAETPVADLIRSEGHALGERATLVQFSSAFCAPCRATRVILDDVAGHVDGVAHVEVDAERHLEATRVLDIRRTPTTIVLDRNGVEVSRASGAPTRDQVLNAVAHAVD